MKKIALIIFFLITLPLLYFAVKNTLEIRSLATLSCSPGYWCNCNGVQTCNRDVTITCNTFRERNGCAGAASECSDTKKCSGDMLCVAGKCEAAPGGGKPVPCSSNQCAGEVVTEPGGKECIKQQECVYTNVECKTTDANGKNHWCFMRVEKDCSKSCGGKTPTPPPKTPTPTRTPTPTPTGNPTPTPTPPNNPTPTPTPPSNPTPTPTPKTPTAGGTTVLGATVIGAAALLLILGLAL